MTHEWFRLPPPNPNTPPHESRMARFGVTVLVLGVIIFVISGFPASVNLDLTPGIGIMQIFGLLIGIGVMTLGGYIYAWATRTRGRPMRLRESVGLRLMATGYVVCIAAGLADVLGFGSHNLGEVRPYLGPVQGIVMLLGIAVIIFGIALYAGRYSPPVTDAELEELTRARSTVRIQLDDEPAPSTHGAPAPANNGVPATPTPETPPSNL